MFQTNKMGQYGLDSSDSEYGQVAGCCEKGKEISLPSMHVVKGD
jgi:hypothetical protein